MFFLVLLNNKFGNKKHLINLTPKSASGDRDINNILDKTHANLKFSKDDLIKGENFLKNIQLENIILFVFILEMNNIYQKLFLKIKI